MRSIVVIAHDIRSIHNVGSIMRTCEGLGVEKLYITGYSPYPPVDNDTRLPHIAHKIEKSMQKTALGADKTLNWLHQDNVIELLNELKNEGYSICALEQTSDAIALPKFKPHDKIAIILGREVEGVDSSLIDMSDVCVVIPMFGQKESFNVVQAAAMALYHCRFYKI